MKSRTRVVVGATIAVVGVLSLATYRYTFPRIERDSSAIRVVKLERQWWRGTALVSLDTDRDGRVDCLLVTPDASGNYSPLHPLLESWEDLDRDGRLETHVLYQDSDVARVEIDGDGDGQAEQVLNGVEAATFLRSRVQAACRLQPVS